MRLIDADALLAEMKGDKWCEDYLGKDAAEGIYDYIEQAPTAYDVDKVVEKLKQHSFPFADDQNDRDVDLDEAIKIIKMQLDAKGE